MGKGRNERPNLVHGDLPESWCCPRHLLLRRCNYDVVDLQGLLPGVHNPGTQVTNGITVLLQQVRNGVGPGNHPLKHPSEVSQSSCMTTLLPCYSFEFCCHTPENLSLTL